MFCSNHEGLILSIIVSKDYISTTVQLIQVTTDVSQHVTQTLFYNSSENININNSEPIIATALSNNCSGFNININNSFNNLNQDYSSFYINIKDSFNNGSRFNININNSFNNLNQDYSSFYINIKDSFNNGSRFNVNILNSFNSVSNICREPG